MYETKNRKESVNSMTRRWRIAAVVAVCLPAAAGIRSVAPFLQPSSHAAAQSSSRSSTITISVLPPSAPAPAAAPDASTDALIRSYQAAVREAPGSATAYTNLALAYMQKERETADVTYYTLTDEALRTALRLDPSNQPAISYEAWVYMGRHDFAGARTLVLKAIRLDPYASANYGTLGDAEANLGNYGAMARAYQKMVDLQPGLTSYNRASYVRWLYGDLPGAFRFMQMAIRAGSTQPENVAWCETQLGDDYMGDAYVLSAEQMYRTALRTFPHYAPALAGLATVELARGHTARAARYYQQAIAIVPLPQYVIALGDLYVAAGNRRAAQQQYALVQFIDHLFAINYVQYGIETALFDADHNRDLPQALSIARATEQTRHDVTTEDTLAWVLYKNGRSTEAWKAERRALRLGTKNALLDFHAGMILAARGDVFGAQHFLSGALTLNPDFHVLYAPVARAELRRLSALATVRAQAGGVGS